MAIIDDIKNRDGETVYPRTLTKAVYEEGTNKPLTELLVNVATPNKLGHVKVETDVEGNVVFPEPAVDNVTMKYNNKGELATKEPYVTIYDKGVSESIDDFEIFYTDNGGGNFTNLGTALKFSVLNASNSSASFVSLGKIPVDMFKEIRFEHYNGKTNKELKNVRFALDTDNSPSDSPWAYGAFVLVRNTGSEEKPATAILDTTNELGSQYLKVIMLQHGEEVTISKIIGVLK